MKKNLLKRKLSDGGVVFGVIGLTTDPIIAEIVGLVGFDFYMIDCEHGAIEPSHAECLVRACESVGITTLVRIRSIDPKLISLFLDTGVMGVVAPGVNDADQLRRLVDFVKYPPVGKRGLGAVRAADYMLGALSQAEYVAFANGETLILPQIESIEAVRHLEEMLRVEGIDGFIIGPRDLAMSMGYYDGPRHKEVRDVIDRILAEVKDAGLLLGDGGEDVNVMIRKGIRLCLTSVTDLIKSGADSYLKLHVSGGS